MTTDPRPVADVLDLDLRLTADGSPLTPWAAVDLDGPVPDDAAGRLPATTVLVGVATRPLTPAAARLASHLTVTLVPPGLDSGPELVGEPDPAAALRLVGEGVERAPRAAGALARLLCATRQLSTPDGLATESATYSMLLAGPEFARWLATGRRPPAAPIGRPAVRLERRGDVLDITVDRPERRNAFDRAVRDGLVDAFDLVLADRSITRAHLRGAGPAFGSGGDLREFGTSEDVAAAHLIRLDRSVAARLDRCRDRVVAHLHGACVGAGIEIPSFAGEVRATADAWFRLPELAMGLVPGAGGTVGITRRIGRWRTAYLALTGVRLGAAEARRWHLVDALDE